MKTILIITHDDAEGPGTLGEFLADSRVRVRTVKLFHGENLPNNIRKFDGIVTTGGAMSAYDEDEYPFLRTEVRFLRKAVKENIPTLGICLGAQLIARACDADVKTAVERERGWRDVRITHEGKRDILFYGLPQTLHVFQWHEDTFEVPHGGVLLATGNGCRNQAFRFQNAYGLQFHIEMTERMFADWCDNRAECHTFVRTFDEIRHDYCIQARMMYANFLWFLDLYKQSMRQGVNKSYKVSRGGYNNVWNRRDYKH